MSNWLKPANVTLFGVTISWRGWKVRPFIRWEIVRIGKTRMFCIGPIAVLVG